MPLLVSVIIPCYNCAQYLEGTLQSVKKQTYPNVELILVDDGSTDDTRAIIERHAGEAVCHFGPNRGASAARNTGANLASGAYLQYLDADDLLKPTALEDRVQALQAAKADVAYSGYQTFTSRKGNFNPKHIRLPQMEEVHSDPEIATLIRFWVPPVALTYTREIDEQIGGWNETLPIIQDARFLQDAAFHGATFIRVAKVLGYYREDSEDSLSSRKAPFHRDIWVNAREIEDRWREHQEELTDAQKKALASVYDHCARFFFGVDRRLYMQARERAETLAPSERSEQLKKYVWREERFGYTFSARAEQRRQQAIRGVKALLRPLYERIIRQICDV